VQSLIKNLRSFWNSSGINRRFYCHFLPVIACLFVLTHIANKNFLLFHSIIELFGIIIAFMAFIITVNISKYTNSQPFFGILGISYGFVAVIDLLHTLSYKGMAVFPGYSANLPAQLWIVARLMQSISMLISCLIINKTIKVRGVFLAYLASSTLLLASVFLWDVFPVCFVDGSGMTMFKIVCEYIACSILTAGIIILLKRKNGLQKRTFCYYML